MSTVNHRPPHPVRAQIIAGVAAGVLVAGAAYYLYLEYDKRKKKDA